MKSCLTLLMACGISLAVSAQTVYEYHEDGKIWFKVKESVELSMTSYDDPAKVNPDELPFLQDVYKNYTVRSVIRPFFIAKDEGIRRIFELDFVDIYNVDKIVRDLSKLPQIQYAEKVNLYHVLDEEGEELTPNDPSYSQQEHLGIVNCPAAWDLQTGSMNTMVCVVDESIESGHPDLLANRWSNPNEIPGNGVDDDGNGLIDDVYGYDFLDQDGNTDPAPQAPGSHGTHTTGIIAAVTNNNLGISGVGHNVSFSAIKVTSNTGGSSAGAIYNGFLWAGLMGADVVNSSVGTPSGTPSSQAEQDIITNAYNAGVLIVAAAGNEGHSGMIYPAAYDKVIAVASLLSSGVKRNASQFGSWIDISCYGSAYSTDKGGSYRVRSGTSEAAPIVAGICALMKSMNPNLSPDDLESCLKSSAINIDGLNPVYAGQLGAGRVDALKALQCVQGTISPLDAGISAIIEPFAGSCDNSITPEVEIKNYGTSTLTGVDVKYKIGSGGEQTKSWTGSLAPQATTSYKLDPISGVNEGLQDFTARTDKPNGGTDGNMNNDSKTEQFTGYINTVSLPLIEGFENSTFPPSGWAVNNWDNNKTWERTNKGAKSGSFSAYVFGYEYDIKGSFDDLRTPAIDLTGVRSMSFELASAMYETGNFSDTLEVLVTTDCGLTATSVYRKFGNAFYTASPTTNDFQPSPGDWRKETIDLSQFDQATKGFIIIRRSNDYENNTFIDDINISKTVGIKEVDISEYLSVFPNPFSGILNLNLGLNDNRKNRVRVYNSFGAKIYESDHNLSGKMLQIDLSEYSSGVYMVEVGTRMGVANKRVVLSK